MNATGKLSIREKYLKSFHSACTASIFSTLFKILKQQNYFIILLYMLNTFKNREGRSKVNEKWSKHNFCIFLNRCIVYSHFTALYSWRYLHPLLRVPVFKRKEMKMKWIRMNQTWDKKQHRKYTEVAKAIIATGIQEEDKENEWRGQNSELIHKINTLTMKWIKCKDVLNEIF